MQLDKAGVAKHAVAPSEGDLVMLRGLRDTSLNREKGFVVECLPCGRLRLKLGQRLLNRVVAARSKHIVLVETAVNMASAD